MRFYEVEDYREIIRHYIGSLSNKGRGELTRIAKKISVNTTLISQIMSGSKDFTYEQGYQVANHIGLNELEMEYFVILIQISRAGTVELKKFFGKRKSAIQKEALKLEKHYIYDKKLTDQEKATYYSSWLYSAARLFASTNQTEGVFIDELAQRFSISQNKATEIIKFLTQIGLCEEKNARFRMTTDSIFLDRNSPHLSKHHSNWRIKAIQKIETLSENEMLFTCPMSISKKDFELIREQLAMQLKKISKTIKDSPSEEVACLNIDLFWI